MLSCPASPDDGEGIRTRFTEPSQHGMTKRVRDKIASEERAVFLFTFGIHTAEYPASPSLLISSGLIHRSENHQPAGRAQGWDPIQFGEELRHNQAAGRKRLCVKLGKAIVGVLPAFLRYPRRDCCLAKDDE